jgi:hypothetical protein
MVYWIWIPSGVYGSIPTPNFNIRSIGFWRQTCQRHHLNNSWMVLAPSRESAFGNEHHVIKYCYIWAVRYGFSFFLSFFFFVDLGPRKSNFGTLKTYSLCNRHIDKLWEWAQILRTHIRAHRSEQPSR